MSGSSPDSQHTIVCRVAPWYYRRMGLFAAMFLGMGLYFIYDGRVGYPKENRIAAEKEWFEREIIGGADKKDRAIESFEEAQQQGPEHAAEWLKMARENRWVINPSLTAPRWADYAAARGWSDSPKKHTEDEIRQQYHWGAAMILIAFGAGVLVLRNHNKTLVGHGDHMVMPNGVAVRYADVTTVDKRKWDHKGLATVHYRLPGGGTRHVVVDDLMFDGAGKVLDRLLSQFTGKLIEKAPEHGAESAEEPATATSPPGPRSAR